MQNLLSLLQDSAVYVVACVILLGVLIFIHELGHFMVARWCGVRVEVFSLGFGRKIWKKTVGDTTYCVSIVPLGGYVKMFGEQPGDHIAPELRAVSFTHKKVSQRIAIVLAGPLMNLFFAAFIFTIIAMMGTETRAPILGDVESGTVAAAAGFHSGDRIVSVDGKPVQTFDDVSKAMDSAIGRKSTFAVQRADGAAENVSVEIASRPNPNPLSLQETIGDIDGLSSLSRASIVGVPKESPLWILGLRPGDRVTAVNGQKVSYFRQLDPALSSAKGPLVVDVERGEGRQTENFTLTLAEDAAHGGLSALKLESPELYLSKVFDNSPAQAAGLRAGDRLVAVNGKTITKWDDVLQTIKSYSGEGGISMEYAREGENKTVKIEPQMTSQVNAFGGEDKRYTIGILPSLEAAMPEMIMVRTLNPIAALAEGARQSWDFSVITVLSFVRLFQNKISPKTVGGLLSIGQAAGETMKLGFGKFLAMMGIISINLFVLNLLPVPVLDGGHLMFYLIEVVKGSPLSLRKIEVAQQIGLVLLMGLMVFALFNDFSRIFLGRG